MSIESHLVELQRRHRTLEREIEDAVTQPSFSALELAALKRKKLYLKDEIQRLSLSKTEH